MYKSDLARKCLDDRCFVSLWPVLYTHTLSNIPLVLSWGTKPLWCPSIKSGCHWKENHLLWARIMSDRQYALAAVCTSFIAHYRFYTDPIFLRAVDGTRGKATIYFEVYFNLWQSRSWGMRCEMFRQRWLVGSDLTGLRKYWINDATFLNSFLYR